MCAGIIHVFCHEKIKKEKKRGESKDQKKEERKVDT
jgi:hypothetical protein